MHHNRQPHVSRDILHLVGSLLNQQLLDPMLKGRPVLTPARCEAVSPSSAGMLCACPEPSMQPRTRSPSSALVTGKQHTTWVQTAVSPAS